MTIIFSQGKKWFEDLHDTKTTPFFSGGGILPYESYIGKGGLSGLGSE